MAGSLKIRVNLGTSCDPNIPTSLMTLTSTAEPNGGDHVATINWGYSPYAEQLNIQLRVSETPEVWIPAPSAFFFSSAGETYTLRTTTGMKPEHAAQLKFPYMVHALYAPDWAGVYDTLQPSVDIVPDDYCCDLPEVPSVVLKSIPVNGGCPGSGYISCTGTIDAQGIDGVSMHNGAGVGHPEVDCWPVSGLDAGTGGSKTFVFNLDPGSFNWFEEAFSANATFAPTNGGSGTVSISITKPANSTVCTLVMTCSTVTSDSFAMSPPSELCAVSLPSCSMPTLSDTTTAKFASFKLNCTTKKLVLYGTSTGNSGLTQRPATYDYCCVCEEDGTGYIKMGWSSSFLISTVEIRVE